MENHGHTVLGKVENHGNILLEKVENNGNTLEMLKRDTAPFLDLMVYP